MKRRTAVYALFVVASLVLIATHVPDLQFLGFSILVVLVLTFRQVRRPIKALARGLYWDLWYIAWDTATFLVEVPYRAARIARRIRRRTGRRAERVRRAIKRIVNSQRRRPTLVGEASVVLVVIVVTFLALSPVVAARALGLGLLLVSLFAVLVAVWGRAVFWSLVPHGLMTEDEEH